MNPIISKKSIGPVIASSLLLVVAVVAVVAYQSWFSSYSSSMFSDVEIKSKDTNSLDISAVNSNILYVKYDYDTNLSVTYIKIGSKSCDIQFNLTKGMNEIPLGFCPLGVDEYEEIILVTSSGINTEFQKLVNTPRTLDLGLNFESPSNGINLNPGDNVLINISSSYVLNNCDLYWNNGSGYVSETMTLDGTNCHITKNNFAIGSYNYYVLASTDLGDGTNGTDISSTQNLFVVCLSLSSEIDADGDSQFNSSFSIYPACNNLFEGHLDINDNDATIIDDKCWLKTNKSSCESNLFIDGCETGTVLDIGTNICWQRDMDDGMDRTGRSDAKNYCSSLVLGSHSDWYLPTRQEFFTIIDYSESYPSLIGGSTYFHSFENHLYWTSTTYGPNIGHAILVYLGSSVGSSDINKNDVHNNALCVRKNN